MSSPRPGKAVRAGQEVVVLRPVKIAPDSVFYLPPGDVGVVDRTSETEGGARECVVSVHGMTVVVPLDAVQQPNP